MSGARSSGADRPVCAARSVPALLPTLFPPLLPALLLALTACALPAKARSAPDDHFASVERRRYAALCRAHKDLDSCSDAVRWSPGDPALVADLADALVRAGRLPEGLRDYRRAEALDPSLRGLDAKIKAAEAKLAERHGPKKPAVDHAGTAHAGADHAGADHAGADRAGADRTGANHAGADHAATDPSAGKRYSNVDPEGESH